MATKIAMALMAALIIASTATIRSASAQGWQDGSAGYSYSEPPNEAARDAACAAGCG